MFSKSFLVFAALSLISFSPSADARIQWLERDGRAVHLYPRRFGQEHPPVIDKLGAACPGQVCGVLSGAAITPLLAAQGECTQQDMADQIIDASRQFDAATQANMIALAKEYRQAEKNTPPDFTTNPPTNRNSVFCQKAPKNAELDGLVQAQDPANDPNLFFDPASKASVKKGSQANTSPFGGSSASPPASASVPASSSVISSSPSSLTLTSNADLSVSTASDPCETVVTVTVTAGNNLAISTSVASSSTVAAPPAASSPAAGNIGDFGSCTVPQIEFATGFDNRKETSFEPVDKKSYNHGSAQNVDIITQFMCDTLVNSCGADQTAKDTCAAARIATDAATKGTGAQADAFNGAFGIKTNFAAIASIDNQGKVVPGTGSSSGNNNAASPSNSAVVPSSTSSAATPAQSGSTGTGGIGDFGSCTVPQIEFATGFDNRKETSFQPVDKKSYAHGSAQNIDIITRAICDTLTNSCGADQTAKDTCAKATSAADTVTKGTGGQADAFNNVFGIKTNFAAVASVDDQGRVVSGTGAGGNTSSGSTGNTSSSVVSSVSASPSSTSKADPATSTTPTGSSSNLQTFTGSLGGVTPPTVTALGNGQFQVTGNSAFNNLQNALVRSCDVQHNQCANKANASGNKGDLTVDACGTQQTQCNAAVQQ